MLKFYLVKPNPQKYWSGTLLKVDTKYCYTDTNRWKLGGGKKWNQLLKMLYPRIRSLLVIPQCIALFDQMKLNQIA